MRLIARIATIILAIAPTTLFSHGGGLNSEGCHHNRKTGDYHCHRSSYAPAPTRNLYNQTVPTPSPSYFSAEDRSFLISMVTDLQKQVEELKSKNHLMTSANQLLMKQSQALSLANRQLRSSSPSTNHPSNQCQNQLNALKASYEQKLASVRRPPANNQQVINLNSLHPRERTNVELYCISVREPAAYNRCIQQQVQALQSAPRLR